MPSGNSPLSVSWLIQSQWMLVPFQSAATHRDERDANCSDTKTKRREKCIWLLKRKKAPKWGCQLAKALSRAVSVGQLASTPWRRHNTKTERQGWGAFALMLTRKWSCWRLETGRSWCGWPCDPADPASAAAESRWSCPCRWQPAGGRRHISTQGTWQKLEKKEMKERVRQAALVPGALDRCSSPGFPGSWRWPPSVK